MLSVQQFLAAMQSKSASVNFPEVAQNHLDAIYKSGLDLTNTEQTWAFTVNWAFKNIWYDHNTPTNQDIKRRMIDREGFLCQSSLVSAILDKYDSDLFTWEDVNGGESYSVELSSGWWEGNEAERDAKIEALREELDHVEEDTHEFEKINDDIELLENADGTREIFEWWVCSSWMIKKLKERGEAILETDFGDWWGRQTTGQAILLDSCISQICFDMEILEYQANDWSKK